MININKLNFAYAGGSLVLDALSAEFPPGMVHAILGSNGAGKSTLLNLMAGLVRPSQGQMTVGNADPFAREPATLADIAMLPEELPQSRLDIRAHADLYAPFWPRFSRELFEDILQCFDVPVGQPMSALSFGQHKKALLAFVLATRARLLLLDEPLNGLDIDAKAELRRLLLDAVSEDSTLIIATHNVREFEGLLDHVSILCRQRFVLHADIHALSEKLAFVTGRETPSNTIHAEPRAGGYAYLLPGDGRHTQPDLELLYQAVLANPDRFTLAGDIQS